MSQATYDRPTAVRPGEELDTARLEAFLRANLAGADAPLQVEQFPSGFSNLTYLLRMGELELVLRRPPFGASIKSAHDMGREYQILNGLHPVYPKAPRPLLYTEDAGIIGAPFYVMERVRGVILRTAAPPDLSIGTDTMRHICLAVVDTLVDLHAVDYQAAHLAQIGRPEGYVERQVRGWTQRYRNAHTDEIPDMEAVAAWLAQRLPPAAATTLIHNDFKLDNLVLDPQNPTQVRAVLDWEMATIGDPLMDLGVALGYWIQPGDAPELQRLGLTSFPGSLRRSEVVDRYAAASGRSVDQIVFYYVFGMFKIGVIAQQIYFRYQQGHTQDQRFAGLLAVVKACAHTARRAMELGRIEDL